VHRKELVDLSQLYRPAPEICWVSCHAPRSFFKYRIPIKYAKIGWIATLLAMLAVNRLISYFGGGMADGGCVIRNRAAERRMIWPLVVESPAREAGSIGQGRRAANHPQCRCIILDELVNHLSIPYAFFSLTGACLDFRECDCSDCFFT
jgi:hypothetical protein